MARNNDSSNVVAILAVIVIVLFAGYLLYYSFGHKPAGTVTPATTKIIEEPAQVPATTNENTTPVTPTEPMVAPTPPVEAPSLPNTESPSATDSGDQNSTPAGIEPGASLQNANPMFNTAQNDVVDTVPSTTAPVTIEAAPPSNTNTNNLDMNNPQQPSQPTQPMQNNEMHNNMGTDLQQPNNTMTTPSNDNLKSNDSLHNRTGTTAPIEPAAPNMPANDASGNVVK